MLMYADDTVLFYSGKPTDPVKKSLNEDHCLRLFQIIIITTLILLIAVLKVFEWASLEWSLSPSLSPPLNQEVCF